VYSLQFRHWGGDWTAAEQSNRAMGLGGRKINAADQSEK